MSVGTVETDRHEGVQRSCASRSALKRQISLLTAGLGGYSEVLRVTERIETHLSEVRECQRGNGAFRGPARHGAH